MSPSSSKTKTIAEIGEFGLIDRINGWVAARQPAFTDGALGIGDDAAVLRPGDGMDLLVTCDSIVEGRHYLPQYGTPCDVGHRAMAMNISDIGAMGGRPRYAFISLGLRKGTPVETVQELYRGFLDELEPFEARVTGGNITSVEGPEFLDITLLGEIEQGRAVRRDTAREGHTILVTGQPGKGAAGLALLQADAEGEPWSRAYLRPAHRAGAGRAVGQCGRASAMIDISDGLLGDLSHVCEGSGLAAEIRLARLPCDPEFRRAARSIHADPLDWILGPSDDYELLITCAPEDTDQIRRAVASVSDVAVTEIGRMVGGEGVSLIGADGERKTSRKRGWDHFAAGAS